MSNMKKTTYRALAAGLFLLLPLTALAQAMSSTNYKVPFDDLSGGGTRSTSTNYIIEDTVAEQASPTGEDLTSTNYRVCVGFECLEEPPFLTVNIATSASACTATTTGSPPFTVALGVINTTSVVTAANHICVRATTNAVSGVSATIQDVSANLKSTATPTDTLPSTTATLVAGTSGYGVCSSNTANGFSAASPFNSSCDTSTNHSVGGLTAAAQTIFSASGAVTNAFGDILTKAAAASSVQPHSDYVDTLTIIVTATY
jgi:hypothetical protein